MVTAKGKEIRLRKLLAAPSLVSTRRRPIVARAAGARLGDAYAHEGSSAALAEAIYEAETGHVYLQITSEQRDALLRAGAANGDEVQVVRFRCRGGLEYSQRCEACNRWVHSVSEEGPGPHEDTCVCGHRLRITYDLSGNATSLQSFEIRCMDCGRLRSHAGGEAWKRRGTHQLQCGLCAAADGIR